jgi:hypothetical protein
VQRIGRDLYELKLPEGIELVHLVFYTSLLRPDPNDPLPRQHIAPQRPVQVHNDATNKAAGTHDEWEVEQILDSRYSYGFLEYKVKWKGYPIEQRKWYRADLFQNASAICDQFHLEYPNKPKPRPEGLRLLQSELDDRVMNRNAARERNLQARQAL